MRIVQICSEFAPIAKAGGLGEALLGLSRELIAQNHRLEVILPCYAFLDRKMLHQGVESCIEVSCEEKGKTILNRVWSSSFEECPLRLIQPEHPSGYFERERIYGYEDDVSRFLYFCRAALEYLSVKGEEIDVLHLHDWHTAACCILMRDLFAKKLKVRSILFTVHNFEYQGRCATWDLDGIGLDGESYLTPLKLEDPDPRYARTINLLKGGVLYADAVNTVSPSYAKETISSANLCPLSPLLRKAKLLGILNGIDTKVWNPETDPHLEARYGKDLPSSMITAQKRANKQVLQKVLNLDALDRPLFGVVSRLMPNKGSDLLQEAIEEILKQGGAFALIGYSPIEEIQKKFDRLQEQYRDHPQVVLRYQYDDALAHQIYAACEFILVPSLVEPCGLTQLIALRYGAIPIVRSTGGLKDTVFDCEDSSILPQKRNGFVFHEPTKEAFHATIARAIALWKTQPPLFLLTQKRAMQGDYSWKRGAKEYIKLYQQLVEKV